MYLIKNLLKKQFILKETINDLLKKCRDLVGTFSHSNALANNLKREMTRIYESTPIIDTTKSALIKSQPKKLKQVRIKHIYIFFYWDC